jgi:hypothetical protein
MEKSLKNFDEALTGKQSEIKMDNDMRLSTKRLPC